MVAATAWGDWMLGDLTDVLAGVVELLGPSREVIAISSHRPGKDGVPRVLVVVEDERSVSLLRTEVERSEFIAEFYGCHRADQFTARVAGMELTVEASGSES